MKPVLDVWMLLTFFYDYAAAGLSSDSYFVVNKYRLLLLLLLFRDAFRMITE